MHIWNSFISLPWESTPLSPLPNTPMRFARSAPSIAFLPRTSEALQRPPEIRPLEPQGLLAFMVAMHKEGISVADINLMTKVNPLLALGLKP